jgi:hypothetical protein
MLLFINLTIINFFFKLIIIILLYYIWVYENLVEKKIENLKI